MSIFPIKHSQQEAPPPNNLEPHRFAARAAALIAAAGMLAVAVGGAIAARAQGPTCRDVQNITVCGDVLVVEANGQFHLAKNVTIGPKGGAAVIKVTDMRSEFQGRQINEATYRGQFFHLNAPDPNTGTADFLIGVVSLIGDPANTPLFSADYVTNLSDPTNVIAGRIFVDPVNKKVFLPAAGAVPVFVQNNVSRSSPYLFNFIDRAQIQTFFKDGASVSERDRIDVEFDLTAKKMNAVIPLFLKIANNDENPNLEVRLRISFNAQGQFSGTLDGFKMKLAGLIADVKSVTMQIGAFEAGLVEVSKVDNPDLPPLDPTNNTLVLSFQKLKYQNNTFSIGGVTTPIGEWVFGDAFRMKNQTLGIANDVAAKAFKFTVNSTLSFGSVASSSDLPIVLSIGRTLVGGQPKPIFSAGLQNFTPNIGNFKFPLVGVAFVGDVASNFYGISATQASIQWPPALGGQAVGITGFKLGINKDKNIVFGLGGAAFATPEFKSSVLKGVLQGTVNTLSNTVTFSMTGSLQVILPGNSGVNPSVNMTIRGGKNVKDSCTDQPAPCFKRYETSLSGFGVKVAGFTLNLTNPRGLDDGGFAADQVAFALPVGVSSSSSGGQINGFSMKGNGDVVVTGGGFELAPITIGGKQFVGLKGSFVKRTDGFYEFSAGGKFPLPGLEPGGNGPGISALVTLRVNPQTNQIGGGVVLTYSAIPGAGIPIGTTGMELSRISGGFDLNQGTVTVFVGMRASTLLRIPPPINIPIVSVDGSATLQLNPAKFTANAQVTLVVFNIASASFEVGPGAGFNGGAGVIGSANFQFAVVFGNLNFRVGKNNATNKVSAAANATFGLGIKKGAFIGGTLPTEDRVFASISVAGGRFNDSDTGGEVMGVKGTLHFIGDHSVFVNLAKSESSSPRIEFRNLDKYSIIPAALARERARLGVEGYATGMMSASEVRKLGLVVALNGLESEPGKAEIVQDTIPVVVTQTTQLVAGINYTNGTGTPALRLQLPNGTILTPSTVNSTTQRFEVDAGNTARVEAFVIDGAVAGNYQLIVDNAPVAYEHVIYTLNQAPVVSISAENCGGDAIEKVTLKCNTSTASGPQVQINWNASDTDSDDVEVSVGYVPVSAVLGPDAIEFSQINILTTGLTLSADSYTWSLDQVSSGKYRMVVVADDGKNPAKIAVGSTELDVTDERAPAVPTGLTGTPQAGEVLVKWTQNTEMDLGGYDIGFGIVNDGNPDDAAHFVYTRTMGPKEIVTGTSNIVDGKLWGLDDNVEMYYSIRAHDNNNNYSDWAPMQTGKPWPLGPKTWTPTPSSAGNTPGTTVDIAFGVPLVAASVQSGITVLDASGQPVAGTISLLTDLDGNKVIGASFKPSSTLAAESSFSAKLKGGAAGVTAEDGRQMPADYAWSFKTGKAESKVVFLPLIRK